jgi:hypothetical protein
MNRVRAALLLVAALIVVGFGTGCTTTHKESGYYHRRGTVHADSFPANYVPGRYRSYRNYGHAGRW